MHSASSIAKAVQAAARERVYCSPFVEFVACNGDVRIGSLCDMPLFPHNVQLPHFPIAAMTHVSTSDDRGERGGRGSCRERWRSRGSCGFRNFVGYCDECDGSERTARFGTRKTVKLNGGKKWRRGECGSGRQCDQARVIGDDSPVAARQRQPNGWVAAGGDMALARAAAADQYPDARILQPASESSSFFEHIWRICVFVTGSVCQCTGTTHTPCGERDHLGSAAHGLGDRLHINQRTIAVAAAAS